MELAAFVALVVAVLALNWEHKMSKVPDADWSGTPESLATWRTQGTWASWLYIFGIIAALSAMCGGR